MAAKKNADLQPVVNKDAPKVKVPLAVEATKPVHKSATVILNMLVALASLVVMIDPQDLTRFVMRHVQDQQLATSLAAFVVAAIGLVNVFIRIYRTRQPVGL